jgi:hypothetical protein
MLDQRIERKPETFNVELVIVRLGLPGIAEPEDDPPVVAVLDPGAGSFAIATIRWTSKSSVTFSRTSFTFLPTKLSILTCSTPRLK